MASEEGVEFTPICIDPRAETASKVQVARLMQAWDVLPHANRFEVEAFHACVPDMVPPTAQMLGIKADNYGAYIRDGSLPKGHRVEHPLDVLWTGSDLFSSQSADTPSSASTPASTSTVSTSTSTSLKTAEAQLLLMQARAVLAEEQVSVMQARLAAAGPNPKFWYDLPLAAVALLPSSHRMPFLVIICLLGLAGYIDFYTKSGRNHRYTG